MSRPSHLPESAARPGMSPAQPPLRRSVDRQPLIVTLANTL